MFLLLVRVWGRGKLGEEGTSKRGRPCVRKDSNVYDAHTRSLKNGLSLPQKRARIVLMMEQWSNTILGPLPGGTQRGLFIKITEKFTNSPNTVY
jgi:hypothetical protein